MRHAIRIKSKLIAAAIPIGCLLTTFSCRGREVEACSFRFVETTKSSSREAAEEEERKCLKD